MPGWDLQLDQMSQGAFSGWLTEARVGGLQVLRERVNRSLLKRGYGIGGAVSFCVPLRTMGHGSWAGGLLEESMVLVSDQAQLSEIRTPPVQDLAIVSVPRAMLDAAACLGGEGPMRGVRLVRIEAGEFASLHALLIGCLEAVSGNGCAARSRRGHYHARKALRDTLLLAMEDIACRREQVIRMPPSSRARLIAKVRELVAANPDTPLSVLDVCRAVGASRRKLQYCFESMVGVNPAHYLRVVRLNAVRRELLRVSDPAATVSDVASRWGFWHLGRFAVNYRTLFGETPSGTLGIARARSANRG